MLSFENYGKRLGYKPNRTRRANNPLTQ